jgi:hypothetical protein
MTGTPRAPWTPEQDKELRALVLSANSVDTIAKALNRTTFAVRRRANILSLPLRKIAKPECDLSRYRRPTSAAFAVGTSIGGRS